MAYPIQLADSARRHLEAAVLLDENPPRGRPDVAGYLYGIAAECALKEIMRLSGMRPLSEEQRRDDPFRHHFPELKTSLRDCANGRHANRLRRYAEDGALMSEWSTKMRYSNARSVPRGHTERWAEQARSLVQDMEGA